MTRTNQTSWTMQELRRLRDELAVQIHLGKAEARDRWSDLEQKWNKLNETKIHPVKTAAAESADSVTDKFAELRAELGDGYRRLRDSLRS